MVLAVGTRFLTQATQLAQAGAKPGIPARPAPKAAVFNKARRSGRISLSEGPMPGSVRLPMMGRSRGFA